jgi:hypothetical protein
MNSCEKCEGPHQHASWCANKEPEHPGYDNFADFLANEADEILREISDEELSDGEIVDNRPVIRTVEDDEHGSAWGATIYPAENHPRLFFFESGRKYLPGKKGLFYPKAGSTVCLTIANKQVADFFIQALQSIDWK